MFCFLVWLCVMNGAVLFFTGGLNSTLATVTAGAQWMVCVAATLLPESLRVTEPLSFDQVKGQAMSATSLFCYIYLFALNLMNRGSTLS